MKMSHIAAGETFRYKEKYTIANEIVTFKGVSIWAHFLHFKKYPVKFTEKKTTVFARNSL